MVVIAEKWFYSGKSGCIREKVVVFGQMWLYSGKKWLYSGKSGCIRAKWLYSGKSGCIRAKVVLFRQKLLYSGKMVFFRESESIREKVVVFGQKWFYTGRSGSIQAKVVVVGKVLSSSHFHKFFRCYVCSSRSRVSSNHLLIRKYPSRKIFIDIPAFTWTNPSY